MLVMKDDVDDEDEPLRHSPYFQPLLLKFERKKKSSTNFYICMEKLWRNEMKTTFVCYY